MRMATLYGNIDRKFGQHASMCNYILLGYTRRYFKWVGWHHKFCAIRFLIKLSVKLENSVCVRTDGHGVLPLNRNRVTRENRPEPPEYVSGWSGESRKNGMIYPIKVWLWNSSMSGMGTRFNWAVPVEVLHFSAFPRFNRKNIPYIARSIIIIL